ncbi:hypothetical protein ACFL09_04745 [Planctomycetota bacterium]
MKKMGPKELAARETKAAWAHEIEHAIDNVKRTRFDKWMRREWHKAAARDHWPEGEKARWVGWRSRRCDGTAGHGTRWVTQRGEAMGSGLTGRVKDVIF